MINAGIRPIQARCIGVAGVDATMQFGTTRLCTVALIHKHEKVVLLARGEHVTGERAGQCSGHLSPAGNPNLSERGFSAYELDVRAG